MHVLLATDRFSTPERARAVGAALARGWAAGAAHDTLDLCPLSDGGPGMVEVLARALGPSGIEPSTAVLDRTALDRGVLVEGEVAYVDSSVGLAAGQGSTPLPGRAAGGSAGVAAQLELALAAGVRRVVVGLGTPADLPGLPDAGAGLLAALGVRGLEGLWSDAGSTTGLAPGRAEDEDGDRPAADPSSPADELVGLDAVVARLSGLDLVVAAATDIALLGMHGACAGAADAATMTREQAQTREGDVGRFAQRAWQARESALDSAGRRRSLLAVDPDRSRRSRGARDLTALPGAGAGGGLGFALALLGARLLPGAQVLAESVSLVARTEAADLVVTARGELDGASFHGSGVEQAALAASGLGIACVALAGSSMMNRRELAAVGLSAAYPLGDAETLSDTGTRLDSGDPPAPGAPPESEVAVRAERVARSWSPRRAATAR